MEVKNGLSKDDLSLTLAEAKSRRLGLRVEMLVNEAVIKEVNLRLREFPKEEEKKDV